MIARCDGCGMRHSCRCPAPNTSISGTGIPVATGPSVDSRGQA